jgi:hypothetical protein
LILSLDYSEGCWSDNICEVFRISGQDLAYRGKYVFRERTRMRNLLRATQDLLKTARTKNI